MKVITGVVIGHPTLGCGSLDSKFDSCVSLIEISYAGGFLTPRVVTFYMRLNSCIGPFAVGELEGELPFSISVVFI